jgi:hypothetical protein
MVGGDLSSNAPSQQMILRVAETIEAQRELAAIVGPANCIVDAADLRTYECDGLTGTRVRPLVVVLPATTAEVAGVVRDRLVGRRPSIRG